VQKFYVISRSLPLQRSEKGPYDCMQAGKGRRRIPQTKRGGKGLLLLTWRKKKKTRGPLEPRRHENREATKNADRKGGKGGKKK